MEDFKSANPGEYAAVKELIRAAEGEPVVYVNARDGSLFVCPRISKLRVASAEWTFYGRCKWIDPPAPDDWPDALPETMAISCGDCLKMGRGWWYDGYFDSYYVYDPKLTARSLARDHSWVGPFLAARKRQFRRANANRARKRAGSNRKSFASNKLKHAEPGAAADPARKAGRGR